MGQSLDIDLLRSFVAIAETGVPGVAAARVGRTQSALSMPRSFDCPLKPAASR